MSLGSDTSEELKLLTENESHLRLITETAPVSIVYIDKDERYVSINAYYEKTHARKKERVIGKTVREVVSADGYARVKPYIDTVLSGKTVSFETTIDRPGQASILIQASYVPDLDPTGKVRGFVAVSTDITQQRIAEFKLRESQESLSFALQSAKMATWEIDLKTNEILCSPEMLELWGLPKSETYLSREVILGKIHPDDVDKVRGEINGAIENGAVYDYEYRVLPVPGEIRWVHSRGRCTYEAGQDRPVKFSGFAFDITQHKNAQQAERFAREKEEWLRQEERFRLILEGVRDCAIYSLDQAGRVVTWNEGAKRIKGYDAQEVLGKDVSWFRLESERGEILFLDLKEAERAGHIEKEGWAFRKGGNRFWASVAITPLRDSEGALIGFVKVTRDLTEHKRLEQMRLDEQRRNFFLEQVKQSEKRLDQIFQESPSFMALLVGPELVFERANREYFRFVSRGRQILGKKARDVFPEVVAQGFIELLENAYRTGEPWIGRDVPVTLNAEDGTPHQVYGDFVFQPIRDAEGEVYAIIAQGYDVTEKALARQASEHSKRMIEIERQNFRNLFKQTPEMVCILYGPDHVFEFVNEAHIRALGFDATGMSVRQAQPESVEVHGILDNVYRTGKTAELFEIPITVTDRVRYFNLTFAARRDEQGQVNGVMILGTEVTEQVLAREELKHAVSARDTFMSIASHELKTPLTSLKLQTQFRARSIQRGEWERFAIEKLPRLISDDEKQINRLIRLVDDMLDVSRIQTGKLTLVGEQFDFSEMIHETLSRFSAQIEMQGCEVSLDVDGDLTGVWDRFRMEQVFTNLLTNALKYGCGKPIEVKLCRAGDQVILTVKDQGLGIAPIDQERVFGQFERAISANTISGLGLGLFISKKIIEAHHGRISVESELEKGSTFTVELPVVSILQQVSRSAEKPEN